MAKAGADGKLWMNHHLIDQFASCRQSADSASASRPRYLREFQFVTDDLSYLCCSTAERIITSTISLKIKQGKNNNTKGRIYPTKEGRGDKPNSREDNL